MPSWHYLDDEVSRHLGMGGIVQAFHAGVAGSLQQPLGGEYVTHTRQLDEEVLAAHEDLRHVHGTALQQFVVEVELIAPGRLDILSLAIDGNEIHI